MAENPLQKIGRILSGVALLQGRMGHQLLGQMLILGSNDLELAAGNVVIAAASGARSGAMKAALQTTGSAIAITLLDRRQRKRLERLDALSQERERLNVQRLKIADQQAASLAAREIDLMGANERLAKLEEQNAELKRQLEQAGSPPRKPRKRRNDR